MPELFGTDFRSLFADALGADLLPMTYTVVTPGTRTPSQQTAGTNPTTADHSCRGVMLDRRRAQFAGAQVEKGEHAVLILAGTLPTTVDPRPGDRLTIEGDQYDVLPQVSRDPAGATYTCLVKGCPA